jgi:hypothetical protein
MCVIHHLLFNACRPRTLHPPITQSTHYPFTSADCRNRTPGTMALRRYRPLPHPLNWCLLVVARAAAAAHLLTRWAHGRTNAAQCAATCGPRTTSSGSGTNRSTLPRTSICAASVCSRSGRHGEPKSNGSLVEVSSPHILRCALLQALAEVGEGGCDRWLAPRVGSCFSGLHAWLAGCVAVPST